MSDDEDWITEDMDDNFLGTPQEPEYVDPTDYSYVDPETGLTPKHQAYLDYKRALELYNYNWVGVPWWARKEDPPRWEDFWQEQVYQQPTSLRGGTTKKQSTRTVTKAEKWSIGIAVTLYVGGLIAFLFYLLWG